MSNRIKLRGTIEPAIIRVDDYKNTKAVTQLSLENEAKAVSLHHHASKAVSKTNYTAWYSLADFTLKTPTGTSGDWKYKQEGTKVYILSTKAISIKKGAKLNIPIELGHFEEFTSQHYMIGKFNYLIKGEKAAAVTDFYTFRYHVSSAIAGGGSGTSSSNKLPFKVSVHGTLFTTYNDNKNRHENPIENRLSIYLINTSTKTITFKQNTSKLNLCYYADEGETVSKPDALTHTINGTFSVPAFETPSKKRTRLKLGANKESTTPPPHIDNVVAKIIDFIPKSDLKIEPNRHLEIKIEQFKTNLFPRTGYVYLKFTDVSEFDNSDFTVPITVEKSPNPKGTIIMWNDSADKMPYGWAICDGREEHGVTTPDLRGLFITGASDNSRPMEFNSSDSQEIKDEKKFKNHSIGDMGGKALIRLNENQLPKHKHHIQETITGGEHSHTTTFGYRRYWVDGEHYRALNHSDNPTNDGSDTHTTNSVAHSHQLDFYTQSTGKGDSIENQPPYYALFYITMVRKPILK